MKLYKVTLRGMTTGIGSNTINGIACVVASDPKRAFEEVKKYVDENDLGFHHERELSKIELIAEEGDYPGCGCRLFIEKGE